MYSGSSPPEGTQNKSSPCVAGPLPSADARLDLVRKRADELHQLPLMEEQGAAERPTKISVFQPYSGTEQAASSRCALTMVHDYARVHTPATHTQHH